MKKVILFLFVFICIVGKKEVYAQMEAAQPIKWDVVKDVDCKMSPDVVWYLIHSSDMAKRVSNGYVTSIKTTEPTSRTIIFSNGNSRLENIVQSEKANNFIVIQIDKESLPQGITSAEITIYAKGEEGNRSNITWRGRVEGSGDVKQALIDQLKAEFDNYAIGYAQVAKSIIPAAAMN